MTITATGWHFGRSFDDTRLEDGCPCVKAPCGLVSDVSDDCDQHGMHLAKTIRQVHLAEACPAAVEVPLFEVAAEPEPEPVATPETPKVTERMMLDALRRRYTHSPGNGPRYVFAEHVRNQCGFGGDHFGSGKLRTADALAVDLWPSSGHVIHGFEVKVSRSDWLHELKDPEKAEAFKPYCDHWWLVVPDASIVRNDLPDGWGLLVDGKVGLRVKRRAPKLDREPMPFGMTAAWLRAVSKCQQGSA